MTDKSVNDTSSKAMSRARTGHLPFLVKIQDKFELHIAWKYSDSTVGLFSDSPRHGKRVPFGSVNDLKFEDRTSKLDGKTYPYICCSSDRDKTRYVAFKFKAGFVFWLYSFYN